MKHTYIYAADFETTVYKGQKKTEVWSSAFCPIRTPSMLKKGIGHGPEDADCVLYGSIEESVKWLESKNRDLICYYHNLKFDGSFWIDWLEKHGYTYYAKKKKKETERPGTYSCLISGKGQWYSVRMVLQTGHVVTLRDSLKIIPFSLKKAAHDFNTPHKKLEMDYEGKRYAGCKVTESEKAYIRNDVLVLAELIEIMYKSGAIDEKTLTIGSACMKKYKTTIPAMYWQENFWQLDKVSTPSYISAKNADSYIRKSYRGGWCYAKQDRTETVYSKANRVQFKQTTGTLTQYYIGLTADVNSLYPSMMHSMSGNRYPIGKPHFVQGSDILEYKLPKYYTFIHLKCAFELKKGYLPFMQIKGNCFYKGTEMLSDSKPTWKGQKYSKLSFDDGTEVTDVVELTLTCADYALMKKHYHVSHETILDGCWFYTDKGMFDDYINYWAHIKQTSTGAIRQIAKLFLNNLYGKFATSPLNISKVPVLEDGIVCLDDDIEPDKKVIYIPIGSAITSYARCFTITAAQKNYSTFCYADTDSIHCLCSREQIKGIKVHPTNFCCWKLESFWAEAVFVRQKTYVEKVCCEDETPIVSPYYNVKCAGMPDSCKQLFIKSMLQTKSEAEQNEHMLKLIPDAGTPDEMRSELEFLSKKRTLADFSHSLVIPGKLMPRRIPGGTLLTETCYTMK